MYTQVAVAFFKRIQSVNQKVVFAYGGFLGSALDKLFNRTYFRNKTEFMSNTLGVFFL